MTRLQKRTAWWTERKRIVPACAFAEDVATQTTVIERDLAWARKNLDARMARRCEDELTALKATTEGGVR